MYVDPEDLDKEVETKIPSDKEVVANNFANGSNETADGDSGTKL